MKTLFFYEWKKIVNRKIVLICMLCAVLLIIFSIGIPLVGDYVVNGERLGSNYEEFQKDITYRKALDGRAIDRTLLMEMQNAYEKVPLDKNKYSLTEEYQSYADSIYDSNQYGKCFSRGAHEKTADDELEYWVERYPAYDAASLCKERKADYTLEDIKEFRKMTSSECEADFFRFQDCYLTPMMNKEIMKRIRKK